jgi:predicted Zn finger-like uncharacterized protein
MKFSCDQCQAQYMIADEKVGPKGVKVRCKKCGNIISVQRDDSAAATDAPTQVTQQPPAGSAFDDLFGQNAGGGAGEEERAPTKVFTTHELERVREEQALAKGDNGGSFADTFGNAAAQPAASAAAPAPEPAATPAKAEWYVAINDEQVGPIADAELQQRWDSAQITGASLAWKAGLPDWAPISSLADLQFLISRPQQSTAKPAPAPQHAPEPQVEEKKEVVTWRPSGASALADLAKEAVVEEPKRPEPQPDASPFGPDFNPQPAGGGDPFGSPAFAGAGGGPSTVWQFPSTATKKQSGVPQWLIIGASVLGVFLIGGIAVLAYAVMNKPAQVIVQQPQQPIAQNLPPQNPQQPVGMPAATGGMQAQNNPPPQNPPPQQNNNPPPANPNPGKVGKLPKGKQPKESGGDTTVAKSEDTTPKKTTKDTGGDGFDDLLGGKKKTQSADVKPTLSRDDVLGTVKSNAPSITKCAEAYSRSGGKLPPKLVAKWVIKPSGFTEGQEMASPELKGTPVDACVVAAIKKWKFPEFQSGTIPVTFPFAVAQ